MKILAVLIALILIIPTIILERKKYTYLKMKITEPITLPDTIKESEEVNALITGYSLLHQKNKKAFKLAQVQLKVWKEKQSDGNTLEDITKALTIVLSLITIMITMTLNVFKDSKMLASDFFDPAMDIIWMLLATVGVITLLSRIFKFSADRCNELINTHIIITDEVAEEPELGVEVNTVDSINSSPTQQT